VKKTSLALGLAAGLAIVAGSALSALPASALTVSPDHAAFYSTDNEFSAVSPDGSVIAYSGYSDSTVTLLNTATHTTTLVTDGGSDLNSQGGVVFSPNGATLYVANYSDIVVIDVATHSVTGTLTSSDFNGPWTIAISHDGTKLYVGNYDNKKIVTYNLGTDATTVTSSVAESYALFVSPDDSTVYNMGYNGDVDVFNTGSLLVTSSFTNVTGSFYSACVNSNASVLYMPDYGASKLYAVSLATGDILATNDTDLPAGNNQSCAVSPDDTKVFVTNTSIGGTSGDYTTITDPGTVTELNAATLALAGSHDLSGVAYSEMINFYDACNAYVAGYYGNAQSFKFDDACVVGGAAIAEPTLASTGLNANDAGALVLALTLAGAIAFAVRRRLAVK